MHPLKGMTIIRMDTGAATKITPNLVESAHGVWSPAGDLIASWEEEDDVSGVVIRRLDGSGKRLIVPNASPLSWRGAR